MGTRIALVRHGETDWNAERRLQGQTDIPLNAAGRDQARAAARELERLGHDGGAWEALVSSPLGRAVETAAIIGGQLGLEAIAPVEGLQERHYGDGEGRIVAGLDRAELDALLATAEPEAEVVARAQTALRDVTAAHPDANIVVVAHGTLIRLVVGSLLGVEHPRVLNGEVVEIDADLLAAPADQVIDHLRTERTQESTLNA
ncbi:histidine phosphatase family protein [Arthrobacter rhombi]|uniref:histidine phosphatase family protein n=1 Tax=Arthrobacter rhombi TaxID=71253 RepID=UPI0031DEC7A2